MRALVFAFASFALVACTNTRNCPTTAPTDGESCHEPGFACEEGGGDHQRCSTISTCSNNLSPAWSNETTAMCTLSNDSACGATLLGTVVGSACPTSGLTCDYSDGRCACVGCVTISSTGQTSPGLGWQCRSWDEGISDSCPTDRPAIGSACKVASQICTYDDCQVTFGPNLQCLEGRWQPLGSAPLTCTTPQCESST